MATITLEYNSRAKGVKNILNGLLELGIFQIKPTPKEEIYNSEFVKMIKDADAAPKTKMTLNEIKKRLGV